MQNTPTPFTISYNEADELHLWIRNYFPNVLCERWNYIQVESINEAIPPPAYKWDIKI